MDIGADFSVSCDCSVAGGEVDVQMLPWGTKGKDSTKPLSTSTRTAFSMCVRHGMKGKARVIYMFGMKMLGRKL